VPDSAIDDCERSHEAANGRKQKADADQFDDTGVMGLICRHDIPLFFANIDTPGEQQKYAVSLIEHLYSLLPSSATICVLYDVGCVLDRSTEIVSEKFTYYSNWSEMTWINSMISYLTAFVNGSFLQHRPCMPMPMNGHANSSSIPAFARALD
jgi:hypothetical protein